MKSVVRGAAGCGGDTMRRRILLPASVAAAAAAPAAVEDMSEAGPVISETGWTYQVTLARWRKRRHWCACAASCGCKRIAAG
jgi:hypothetical protein